MRKEYTFHSREEKLKLVKRCLAGESPKVLGEELGVDGSMIRKWRKQYLLHGENALENQKKPGNPLLKYTRKKILTREEELEYQVELLKMELMRKEAEIFKIKKFIEFERGDQKRK
jgi:transposase-like protein